MEALTYNNTRPWGDMLYEDEQNRRLAFLRMPRPEWLACVNAYFNRLRGNGSALIGALAWFQQMEAQRAAFNTPAPVPVVDDDTRNWRVWKDMVEEPEKYGEDIGQWIELDEEVRRGPKRWRVDAHWNNVVRQIEEGQTMAATRIQSLWRGHVARTVMAERFNCGRCLTHVACSAYLEDDNMYVCRECKMEWDALWRQLGEDLAAEEEAAELHEEMRRLADELNAEEDPSEDHCDDCGEEVVMYGAKVGELHLCPQCIHDWEVCTECDRAKPLGGRCDNHCSECREPLTGMGGGCSGFCSAECRLEYMRDCWRDSR